MKILKAVEEIDISCIENKNKKYSRFFIRNNKSPTRVDKLFKVPKPGILYLEKISLKNKDKIKTSSDI